MIFKPALLGCFFDKIKGCHNSRSMISLLAPVSFWLGEQVHGGSNPFQQAFWLLKQVPDDFTNHNENKTAQMEDYRKRPIWKK